MRLAAAPMSSVPFEWKRNTAEALRHVERCSSIGAELVLLPELFAVGYCYHDRLVEFAESRDGNTVGWMKGASQALGTYIGGTFIERQGRGVFNTFALTGPDGSAQFYRKSSIPLLERFFFSAGSGGGVMNTALGRIGILICWDITNRALVNELSGRIDLLLICEAWPDAEMGTMGLPWIGRRLTEIARRRPVEIARQLQVPTMVCNMGGVFETPIPLTGICYRAPFVDTTSLISASGCTLSRARRTTPMIADVNGPAASASFTHLRKRATAGFADGPRNKTA